MSASRRTKEVIWRGRLCGFAPSERGGGEIHAQARSGELKQAPGIGDVAQTMHAEIDQLGLGLQFAVRQVGGGLRNERLAAVGDRQQPRRAIDALAEIVAVALLDGAGVDRHSDWQAADRLEILRRKRAQGRERGPDRLRRRDERGAERVAGGLEHTPVVRCDGATQGFVVQRERGPHRPRRGLPAPHRSLYVSEQERQHAAAEWFERRRRLGGHRSVIGKPASRETNPAPAHRPSRSTICG